MSDTREVSLLPGTWIELSAVSCTFSSLSDFDYAQSAAEPTIANGHVYDSDHRDVISWGLPAGVKLWVKGNRGKVIVTEQV